MWMLSFENCTGRIFMNDRKNQLAVRCFGKNPFLNCWDDALLFCETDPLFQNCILWNKFNTIVLFSSFTKLPAGCYSTVLLHLKVLFIGHTVYYCIMFVLCCRFLSSGLCAGYNSYCIIAFKSLVHLTYIIMIVL